MNDALLASRYRLERVVSRGGLGTLYLAEQLALKRAVLVRVVSRDIGQDATRRRLLVESVEQLSRIDDKGLVPMLDRSEIDGQPFYAMEFVTGTDLRSVLHGDMHALPGAVTPPDFEVRTRGLRDFLRSCRKLADSYGAIGGLRASEVLLVAPFRFVLAEPGLAARCAPAGAPRGEPLQDVLERGFALTFDPTWDAHDRHNRRSTMAMRSSLFLDLSRADTADPVRLLDHALECLQRAMEARPDASGVARADVLVRGSGSSARWRVRPRHAGRLALATIFLTAGALLLHGLRVDARSASEREARVRLATAQRKGDLGSLHELAHRGGVPADIRASAGTALESHLLQQLDSCAAAALEVHLAGGEVQVAALLPATTPAAIRTEQLAAVGTVAAALVEQGKVLRAVFGTDHEARRDALLALVMGAAPRPLCRAVLLRLLHGPDAAMGRAAAAAFASGLAERPLHLDAPLRGRLTEPEVDPGIALALVGYFRCLPESRGVETLAAAVHVLGPQRHAQSPNSDRFAVSLCRVAQQTDDVLGHWIGRGHDAGVAGPQRMVPLRVAALFALESIAPSRAVAFRSAALTEEDRAFAKAVLLVVGREAERLDRVEIGSLLQAAVRSGDVELMRPLTSALAAVDPTTARQAMLAELQAGRAPDEAVVLDVAVEAGLISGADVCGEFLLAIPVEAYRSVAQVIERRRTLSAIVGGGDRARWKPAVVGRVALLRGLAGKGTQADVDLLQAMVRDRGALPPLRVLALDALVGVLEDRSFPVCSEVLEGASYPRELRVLALRLAQARLGTSATSYLTSRVDTRHQAHAGEMLRSMVRALGDSDPLVRDGAAHALAGYDSAIVTAALRQLLDPAAPLPLIELATGYFARMQKGGEPAPDLESEMLALVDDPDMSETVIANAISWCENNDCSGAVDVVLTVLPVLGTDEAALSALSYLATREGDPAVIRALVDYVEGDHTIDARLVALEQLGHRMRQRQAVSPELVTDIMTAAVDPEVAFACAAILIENGAPCPAEPLLEAYRRHLAQVAGATSGSSRAAATSSGRSSRLASPRVVLACRAPAFDEALVALCSEQELEGDSLARAAAFLVLRLAKAGAGPDALLALLRERRTDIAQLTARWQVLVMNHWSSPLLSAEDAFEALDYLCLHCHAQRDPAPFHARANVRRLLSDFGEAAAVGEAATPIPRHSMQLVVEDLRWALSFSGEDSGGLQLELFAAQVDAGDLDGALETLDAYQQLFPSDPRARHLGVDMLIRLGRVGEAAARLERFGDRGIEYWRRSVSLSFAAVDDAPERVAALLEAEEWRQGRMFLELVPTLLGHLFERREDARFASIRAEVADRLTKVLRTDFSWHGRETAAFHLAWLAPDRCAPVLALSARSDASMAVRADALWGLSQVDPAAAAATAGELMGTNDAKVRQTAYWVLWRLQQPGRIGWLQRGLGPRSHWLSTAVDLAVTCDEAAVIPEITQLLDHPDAAIRARAARALGMLGCRGHEVDRELLRKCYFHEVDHSVATESGIALARMGDEQLFESCQRDVRRCVEGHVLPQQAVRILPARLEVLAVYPAPAALALIRQVVEWRRSRLPAVDRIMQGVPIDSSDDEAIGDVADWLAANGEFVRAESMYRRAAELDPSDSEWTRKLQDLRNGRVPDVAGTVGGDPVLWAGTQAMVRHQQRQQPVQDWQEAGGGQGLVSALVAALARDGAQDAGLVLPAALTQRFLAALQVAENWPQFVSRRLGEATDGPLTDQAMAELADRFGEQLPAVLVDASDVVTHLPVVHAALTDGDRRRSEGLAFARVIDQIRQGLLRRSR